MTEVFWLNDINILHKNYFIFFPHKNYTLEQNLNAIVRLFIYYSLICFIVYKDTDAFIPLLLILFISIMVYNSRKSIESYQKMTPNKTSTSDNPMMNPSIIDYTSSEPIIIDNSTSNETMNENLVGEAYKVEDGNINKNAFERQFYTMPVTDCINDQTEFAKWLYDTGPTCKEDTTVCPETLPDRLQMGRGSIRES